jgi:hypothetical protein
MAFKLDKDATSQIEWRRADARHELAKSVRDFVRGCSDQSVLRRLKRLPNACDLKGYFRSYAERTFDEEAKHLLANVSNEQSVKTYARRMDRIETSILQEIKKSLWNEIVEEACGRGHSWETEYGEFETDDLKRPCLMDIPRDLAVRKRFWEAEALGIVANGAKPRFPRRGAWLRDRMMERDWNVQALVVAGGPDRKTIKKILEGRAVTDSVFPRLAKALNQFKSPDGNTLQTVEVNDIPKD